MNFRYSVGASLAVALLAGSLLAADSPKSGPQIGQGVTPFNPLHVTGSGKGGKSCLVWRNGGNPVAMIFAREINDGLTSLVKKIDEATAKHSDCRMGSFVVFCNDDEGLRKKLEALADKEKLKHTILTIDNPTGPEGYNIAKDAEVTVVLYTKQKVKVNHAFKKGELKDKDIDRIVSEVSKILPEKKK